MHIILYIFFLANLSVADENVEPSIQYIQVGVKERAPSTAEEILISEARLVAKLLKKKLGNTLKKSIQTSGVPASIKACSELAPEIAIDLSKQFDAKVTRVSLKHRNPLIGAPDSWEQLVLTEFDDNKAILSSNTILEKSAIVNEPRGFYFRYMQTLVVKPVCLSCHGRKSDITTAVESRIEKNYPNDIAKNYDLGDIRGAISIKKLIK